LNDNEKHKSEKEKHCAQASPAMFLSMLICGKKNSVSGVRTKYVWYEVFVRLCDKCI